MRDGERLAVVVVFELLRVETQRREPRVEHVTDVAGIPFHRCAESVGLTDREAAFQAATGLRGVRPNSDIAITRTLFSIPRSCRSSMIDANA